MYLDVYVCVVVESIESERAEAMMYEREEAMREARSKAICGVVRVIVQIGS